MHYDFIRFFIEHSQLVCIPIGISLRYIKLLFDKSRSHGNGKSHELLIDKTYEHMKDLRERGDTAVRKHSNLLARYRILQNKNKGLKENIIKLSETIYDKEKRIKELEFCVYKMNII